MPVRIKRVYAKPEPGDGKRILVDRLWPRGVRKSAVDVWIRDVAPSDALRNWFHHEERKWSAFRKKYLAELAANDAAVAELRKAAKGRATLVYGAKDETHNQAVVLAELLDARAPRGTRKNGSRKKTRARERAP